jgi:hypothetical protein
VVEKGSPARNEVFYGSSRGFGIRTPIVIGIQIEGTWMDKRVFAHDQRLGEDEGVRGLFGSIWKFPVCPDR